MLQQILSIYRGVTLSMRPNKVARRSAHLAATVLEERATPAVVDGVVPPTVFPDTVQLAPISHEANVRADLFGKGESEPAVNRPEENMLFVGVSAKGEDFAHENSTPPAPQLELRIDTPSDVAAEAA